MNPSHDVPLISIGKLPMVQGKTAWENLIFQASEALRIFQSLMARTTLLGWTWLERLDSHSRPLVDPVP